MVGVVAAEAEVLEPAAVSDAEAGDAQLRRGQLTAEVVATAERVAGFRYDVATQQRGECPQRRAPGILSR